MLSELFSRLAHLVLGGPSAGSPEPIEPWVRRPRAVPKLSDPAVPPAAVDPSLLAHADALDLPPDARSRLVFDPSRAYVVCQGGTVMQMAVIDVLLVDDQMTRLAVYAYYDAQTFEPLRLSYVPIHELEESVEVGSHEGPPDGPSLHGQASRPSWVPEVPG